MKNIRIAIGQINPIVGDIDGNAQKIIDTIQSSCNQNVDMIIFPKMAVCGYPCFDLFNNKKFIDKIIAANNKIIDFTAEVNAPLVIFGTVHRIGKNSIFDAALLAFNGKLLGYKANLSTDKKYNTGYFEVGTACPTRFVYSNKLNFLLTLENNEWNTTDFIELQDAPCQLVVVLGNDPYTRTTDLENEMMLCNKSSQIRTPLVYVNLAGGHDNIVLSGGSMIIDSTGNVVLRAKSFNEDIIISDIEINDENIVDVFPLYGDLIKLDFPLPIGHKNKPERIQYNGIREDEIPELWECLATGIRDYTYKNGFSKVILGLSGGIDSALVAALSTYALGNDGVVGVTLPAKVTSLETFKDSVLLAKNLNIKLYHMQIKDLVDNFILKFEANVNDSPGLIAVENLQSRIRMINIMLIANTYGYLPLCTGNKSEAYVGYCTLHGDLFGGLAPIADVYKTMVYKLSEYGNIIMNNVIPIDTITRPPTAELSYGQKDQDKLPPYEILDKILQLHIDNKIDADTIIKMNIASREEVLNVIQMIKQSEFKRHQSPVIINVTNHNNDVRRVPLTHKYIEM